MFDIQVLGNLVAKPAQLQPLWFDLLWLLKCYGHFNRNNNNILALVNILVL